MDFSPPIFIASLRVLVRTADQIRSVDQLTGKPVVVIARTSADTRLSQVIPGKTPSFTLSKAVSAEAALGQLQLGWVAGYARDDVLLATQVAASAKPGEYLLLPESLGTEPIGIAFRRGDTALATQVRAVMADMHKSGELVALYERWFLRPLPPNNLTLGIALPESLRTAWSALR
jgi:glutamate/aspartate transport system substrate-binding protein